MEAIIALIVGVVLISLSVYSIQANKLLNKNGIKTEGIVFDIVDSQTSSLRYKTPIVRFLDLNKQWITDEAKVGIANFQYKPGDKVVVIYEKDNPKNFIIQDRKNNNILLLLLTSGIVISIIALGILICNS
jgi:hypothetical protein